MEHALNASQGVAITFCPILSALTDETESPDSRHICLTTETSPTDVLYVVDNGSGDKRVAEPVYKPTPLASSERLVFSANSLCNVKPAEALNELLVLVSKNKFHTDFSILNSVNINAQYICYFHV